MRVNTKNSYFIKLHWLWNWSTSWWLMQIWFIN